jgi:hypothetical protein
MLFRIIANKKEMRKIDIQKLTGNLNKILNKLRYLNLDEINEWKETMFNKSRQLIIKFKNSRQFQSNRNKNAI